MTERAANRVRVSETRCPYCHDEIVRGEEPVACPACHAPHHEECLRERPFCSACGTSHPRFAGASTGSVRVYRRKRTPRTGLIGLVDDLREIAGLIARLFGAFAAPVALFRAFVDRAARLLSFVLSDNLALYFAILGVFGAGLIGLGVVLVVVAASG